jgi:hypothetical protein
MSIARKSLHSEVVEVILPRFAENLKKEGIISDYNRKSFGVEGATLLKKHTFSIRPDLLLVLPDAKRFLVEIVNPKDPKRFLGEIACVQLLGLQKLIDAAIIFILPLGPEHPSAPEKGVRLSLATLATGLDQVISSKIPGTVISWSTNQDFSYSNLKGFILSRRPSWWGE